MYRENKTGAPAGLRALIRGWMPTGEIGDFPEEEFPEVVDHAATLPDGRVAFTFTCGLVLAEGVRKEEAA